MASCDFLGHLEFDETGKARIRPMVVSARPAREHRPVAVPISVAQSVQAGETLIASAIGEGMEPLILDNDTLVVSRVSEPHDGDIVLVHAAQTDAVVGERGASVWRFHHRGTGPFLTRANPDDRASRSVCRKDILGVVVRIIHREFRDPDENHVGIQKTIAIHRACKWETPPADLGFHSDAKLAELRTALQIPESELLGGRLPWGLFRGRAVGEHRHLGIQALDTLSVEVTREGRAGLVVIVRNKAGDTLMGTMEREGLKTPHPGGFYINQGSRRIALTRNGGRVRLWWCIAVVRSVHRHGRWQLGQFYSISS